MKVIDIHTHIIPPRWDDMAAEFGGTEWPTLVHDSDCSCTMYVDGVFFRQMRDVVHRPDRRIEEMDAGGVDMHLLSPMPKMWSYWAPPRGGAELCKQVNDYIAEVVADSPRRFFGAGMVPMQDVDLAVTELVRMKEELDLTCVEIGTNINGVDLGHESLRPFFEAAADLDVSIFIHGWDVLGGQRMRRFYFPHLVGLPLEEALCIASLIFGGVLDQFPDLRICVAHGGGAFPYVLGRLLHGYDVRPEAREAIPRSPEYYARKLYFDSITHDLEGLRFLLERFGEDRVLFGSDYPFDMGSSYPVANIEYLSAIPEHARAKVFGKNALRFLNRRAPDR